MHIQNAEETKDLVTPVDDPCQFDPAWRSCVAGHLFSMGVRSNADFDTLSKFGFVVVTVTKDVTVTENVTVTKSDTSTKSDKKGARGKESKSKNQAEEKNRKVTSKVNRPIEPFYSHPEYRRLVTDKYVRLNVKMVNEYVAGRRLSDDCVPLRLAKRWYQQIDHEAAIKKRLEPLLLTGIGMDIVTLDVTGDPDMQPVVEAYEKLYFNCRNDDFTLNRSAHLVNRIAMPYGPLKTYLRKWEEVDDDGFVIGDGRPLAKESDIWKSIAATMGYEALMYAWRWERFAHGMKGNSLETMIDLSWKVAASKMFTDLFTGNIAHEDAARILAAYTAQAKKISDDRQNRAGSEDSDTTKALMNILYRVSPRMITIDASEEAARNEEIQNRIQSQLAITKQEIVDNGKQVEAEVIDAQINNAVGGGQ